MSANKILADHFGASRPRLKALAYRMLGSVADAEDALHDAWVRITAKPVDPGGIETIEAWLTTAVARVCLNKLRARKARPEDAAGLILPDLLITGAEDSGPERDIELAQDVGLALQVVLETLAPAERIAFVLHDLFGFPFERIAAMIDRTPPATRKLASRARQRMQEVRQASFERDRDKQKEVVEAFFVASRRGDLDGLIKILDPDVAFIADGGTQCAAATAILRGAADVARRAATFSVPDAGLRWVRVNGSIGVVVTRDQAPVSIMVFAVSGGRITDIHVLLDPDRIGPQLAHARTGAD